MKNNMKMMMIIKQTKLNKTKKIIKIQLSAINPNQIMINSVLKNNISNNIPIKLLKKINILNITSTY